MICLSAPKQNIRLPGSPARTFRARCREHKLSRPHNGSASRGNMAVNPSALQNIGQTFNFVLYERPLHPELFELRGRRVIRHDGYELECWVFAGGHALRFEMGGACYIEVISPSELTLPEANMVDGFPCMSEHETDQHFPKDKIGYINTIQSEQLGENLFRSTYDEMLDYAREADAMVHRWECNDGPCMSIVDVQRYNNEVHAQCYHLLADSGTVLRTQTIFERRD